jgi:hypothetical protein
MTASAKLKAKHAAKNDKQKKIQPKLDVRAKTKNDKKFWKGLRTTVSILPLVF